MRINVLSFTKNRNNFNVKRREHKIIKIFLLRSALMDFLKESKIEIILT